MPLVYAGSTPPVAGSITEQQERARKIKPQLAEGRLVRVAGGRNQAEAEFIQGMLLEEGVPSTLRRTAGFDVPDFLAAGPRDVLVPESGAQTAREVLLDSDMASTEQPGPVHAAPRVLVGVIVGFALVLLIAVLGVELLG